MHAHIYPMAANAQSGVKQSVVSQSVSQSVIKKILKSVHCAQYTALKNIGIREKGVYFPSWAPFLSTWISTALKNIGISIYFPSWVPVLSTWIFLGVLAVPKISKVCSIIANYMQIRMECTDNHGEHAQDSYQTRRGVHILLVV